MKICCIRGSDILTSPHRLSHRREPASSPFCPQSLDALINNAGVAHVGNVLDAAPDDIDRLYRINIRGVYHCLHFGLPLMLKNGVGSIVNLASIASKVGIPDRFASSMTKGAVLSMTLSVARDFVDKGVRCNCVCPARVHTPFVDGFLAKTYPGREAEMFAKLSDGQPIGPYESGPRALRHAPRGAVIKITNRRLVDKRSDAWSPQGSCVKEGGMAVAAVQRLAFFNTTAT